jgi:thiol-disulfide isomerase/thioredoxin
MMTKTGILARLSAEKSSVSVKFIRRQPVTCIYIFLQMGNASSSQSYDTQPDLAKKLAQSQPIVIAFLQPSCGLCRSLEPQLAQVGI